MRALLVAVTLAVACTGPKGDPGATGSAGTAGPKGDTGAPGAPGAPGQNGAAALRVRHADGGVLGLYFETTEGAGWGRVYLESVGCAPYLDLKAPGLLRTINDLSGTNNPMQPVYAATGCQGAPLFGDFTSSPVAPLNLYCFRDGRGRVFALTQPFSPPAQVAVQSRVDTDGGCSPLSATQQVLPLREVTLPSVTGPLTVAP